MCVLCACMYVCQCYDQEAASCGARQGAAWQTAAAADWQGLALCPSVCLFVCRSVCPSVCLLFICLSICLFVCLFICLFICLSISLFICLFICLSICLSVCLFVCLFMCLSICLFVCLSVRLSVCLCVCPSVCLSVCLYVCLSVCPSVSVPVSDVMHGSHASWEVLDFFVKLLLGIWVWSWTQCLSNNTHCWHWSRTHYSPPRELNSALTAATILADASVTPPSPKWPKMCRVGR